MNLKNLLSFFSLTLVCHVAFAQNPYITEETVGIVAQWEVGDTASYLYESNSETIKEEKKDDYFSRSGEIFVKVAKADEHSYILHWSYKNLVTDENSSARLKVLGRLMSQSVFKYRVNEVGQFEEIINWNEIRIRANQQLDAMLKESKSPDEKALIKGVKEGLQSKEAVTYFLGQDIIFFHYIMGIELSRKEPLKTTSELPNLFIPSKPYPCDLVISTDSINTQTSVGYFSIEQTGDVEACTEILRESLATFIKGGKKKELDEVLTEFQLKDNHRFIYDLDTGWPLFIQQSRNSNLVIMSSKVNMTITKQ
ncbi:MAG: hypothetical protein LPK45_09290 [Bacteroidota bacterium]|nr:hypothetical protein [Bacteroidota bacterium]MDX5431279.1 hypothetical protein [Bacteroidota bacterium]MDX5470017.1 hypothetical protein [Bacteroidota bacterium]